VIEWRVNRLLKGWQLSYFITSLKLLKFSDALLPGNQDRFQESNKEEFVGVLHGSLPISLDSLVASSLSLFVKADSYYPFAHARWFSSFEMLSERLLWVS
jgi:hypothetical protein